MRASARTPLLAVVLAGIAVGAIWVAPATRASSPSGPGTLTIVPVSPLPNGTVSSTTPTIRANFEDTGGVVDSSSVYLFVDGLNVTGVQSVTITPAGISYVPPTILTLSNGTNNVTVEAADSSGHSARLSWSFTVNPSAATSGNPLGGLTPTTILLYVGVAAAVAAAAVGGYVLWLKRTSRFTFRKYFATHPVKRQYLVLYVPAAAAFLTVLLGLSFVYSTPGLPHEAPDFVLVLGAFVGLTAFGLDARQEMIRTRAHERAFSQLLFEMADAMRGGIDPAKAVVELSKTHTNILRKPLRIAADSIRIGRAFEVVLRELVAPMRSDLVRRYGGLIADATGVGGETATVVYRAAKDMDDFVKIEDEREKQLLLPVAVIYIAFGVLMAVLFALLSIAPELGTLNVSFLGLGGSPLATGSAGPPAVPHLDLVALKERFFELMLINALGTGAIIGAFTEGRARYGTLHSLGLLAATTLAFAIVFPG